MRGCRRAGCWESSSPGRGPPTREHLFARAAPRLLTICRVARISQIRPPRYGLSPGERLLTHLSAATSAAGAGPAERAFSVPIMIVEKTDPGRPGTGDAEQPDLHDQRP